MKVGDLVRDKEECGVSPIAVGIIIEIDEPEGMFKVIWDGKHKEWLTQMYMEVISESR